MARLHVLAEWHGPGEQKTAERLRDELPDGWDVIAGRQLPSAMGAVDIDLIVVGERAVYVCEEKAWGPHVVAGEVAWYVGGERRPDPSGQTAHAARVLAGRLRDRVTGWAAAQKALPRGHRPVFGHVVLSHDRLLLEGAGELGEDVVLRLAEASKVLQERDARFPTDMAALRPRLMTYLLGLGRRSDTEHPSRIHQYSILGAPDRRADVLVYPAVLPTEENVLLYCVPVAAAPDAAQAHRLATREHDALAALASKERTWRVQSWFEWDGYTVTPVVVAMDGTSLGKLAATGRPAPDSSARVSAEAGVAIVHDAFVGLSAVHAEGITHRALQMRSVEVTPAGRVRFRDFGRSRIADGQSIAVGLDDDHPSAMFRPPGLPLGFAQPRDDVYSLALCLVQWLHGDAADDPDHDLARRRAEDYPEVGATLARCLALDPANRPDASEAASATEQRSPQPTSPSATMAEDELIAGRHRLIRRLGEGSWAVTWLARDEQLDQERTLKHLRPDRVTFEQAQAEFAHSDRLRSRCCARVYDLLPEPGPGVIVQEYVPGQTLSSLAEGTTAAGRRLEREQVRRIAVDLLTGLADAHEQGIYHRDVSPNNVIVREDGRAVLIDFGLAAPVDAARSVVGSPPFTAPEVWASRSWSPAADVYSAAVTVLWATLGRYPYADTGDRTLVGPTTEDVQRYGSALLSALYAGVAPDREDRPGDAAAYAERVRHARDSDGLPMGQRLVNPTVEALRGLYRHSARGNAGNRGMDDEFALGTYAATRLDTVLLPAVLAGELDVVVLSGNPGDGKTSFLVRVGEALDHAGAEGPADAAGWRKTLHGRTFAAVYDASESHGELTSDDLIRAALDGCPEEAPARTVLLAANDGRIAQFLSEHGGTYPRLASALAPQLHEGAAPTGRIVLVDLKRRALAQPSEQGPSLGGAVLDLFTDPSRWAICDGCTARSACPIRANVAVMRREGARDAVVELLLVSHLRRRRRATVRDVRSALSWLLTGDRSCTDVHREHGAGQDPASGADRHVADLAFSPHSGDYLVDEWSELDPARLPAPGVARAARADRDLVPDLSAVEREVMRSLKRRLFFALWPAPGAEPEVRSYRYLRSYIAALRTPEDAVSALLLGLSRVLAFPGYAEPGLALRERTFDDPATRAIVVVKELPPEEFTLTTSTVTSPHVESFPDQLVLRHRSGPQLRIPLDTAELLFRAADGEILGDTASASLRREIEGFGDRLRLQPAQRVRIVDGSGRSVTAAVVPGGRIRREAP
ncbi:protein kinase domain-containing protein [Actinomycetospora chibensis]|uniref:Protein kinase n=1 Tax=Actinomycetospora chibensis TaxID=663606 RepID=A0ABV9RBC1_9PSEU|nr:protein kinase [Actinomycetospora chibensis]MDD7924214.1 protein kinase [Actinomycetospora chibensis]